MKKLRNIDLRNLKDKFFDDFDKEKKIEEKVLLYIVYEYTIPKGQGITEKQIKTKWLNAYTQLCLECCVRKGLMKATYGGNGKIKTVSLRTKGSKEALKLIKKYNLKI